MNKSVNKPHKKTNNMFFRINEEGKDIFYPWGYPGEAFYVDDELKKKIKRYMWRYAGFIGFLLFFLFYGIVKGIIPFNAYAYTSAIVCIFLFYIGFLGATLLKRKAKIYLEAKEKRLSKISTMLPLWGCFMFIHISAIVQSINNIFIDFIILNSAQSIFLCFFFYRLIRSKGYYFSSKIEDNLRKPIKKTDRMFFRINEEGKEVFYPWGNSGEAFYVDNGLKKKIKIYMWLYAGFIGFLLFFLLYGVMNKIIHFKAYTYTSAIICIFLFYIGFLGACLLKRKAETYLVTKENRASKISTMLPLWGCFMYIHISALIQSVSDFYIDAIAINSAQSIFLCFFFYRLIRSKGYYFSSKIK